VAIFLFAQSQRTAKNKNVKKQINKTIFQIKQKKFRKKSYKKSVEKNGSKNRSKIFFVKKPVRKLFEKKLIVQKMGQNIFV